MKKPKLNKKYWAVIHSEIGKLEYDAYFNGGDCCCSGEPLAVAIYDKKTLAEDCVYYNSEYDIYEVEIKLDKKIIK